MRSIVLLVIVSEMLKTAERILHYNTIIVILLIELQWGTNVRISIVVKCWQDTVHQVLLWGRREEGVGDTAHLKFAELVMKT